MSDNQQTAAELATLRERIGNTLQRLESIAIEMKRDREEFHKAVSELRGEIVRYKGFLGGIAFVFSCLIAAFMAAKGWLFNGK